MITAKWKIITNPVPIVQGLNKQLQRRAIAKAIKAAIEPVKQAVMDHAEGVRLYGFLAQSIGVKVKVYRTAVVGVIGPRSKFVKIKGRRTRGKNKGQSIKHRPAWYAHLLESGTKRTRARPFLKPSLVETQQRYFDDLADGIRGEIAGILSRVKIKKGG